MKLIKQFGIDTYKYLLRCLIENIDFHGKLLNTPDSTYQIQADHTRVDLLKQILNFLMVQNNFFSVGTEVLSSFQQSKVELIRLFSRKLGIHEISLLILCLIQSQDQQIKFEGLQLLKDEILNAPHSVQNMEEVIQRIIYYIPKLSLYDNEKETITKELQKAIRARELASTSVSVPNPLNTQALPGPGYSQHPGHIVRPGIQIPQNSQLQTDMHLAKLFREFGYIATASEDIVREIFKIYKKDIGDVNISSQTFSCLIGEIISSYQGLKSSIDILIQFLRQFGGANVMNNNIQDPGTWKLESLIPVLKEFSEHLDWSIIIEGLDYPDFKLIDKKALANLIFLHEKITGGASFPIDKIITKPWLNKDAQLQFCLLGLTFPPSALNFTSDKLHEINSGSSISSKPLFHHIAWNSIEFIETMLNLAKEDKLDIIVKHFEKAIQDSPDLLMIGVAQSRPRHYLLQSELIFSYIQPKLSNPKLLEDSIPVISQILLVNPELFSRTLNDIFVREPSTLDTIVDVLTELNVTELIIASSDPKFATHLAVTSSFKRDNLLNFSLWLKSVLVLNGNLYIESFLSYLKVKLPQINLNQKEHKELLKYIALIYRWIPLLTNITSTELQRAVAAGIIISQQVWDEVLRLQANSPFDPPKDVEEIADGHLKNIFSGEISMEKATAELQKFKESTNQKSRTIYACIIHNLFDEYRFFPKYSDRDLLKAATLFGSIINKDIIKGITLDLAKNFIFSSWISNDQRMLQFAVIALNEFKGRIKEWPHFCSFLKYSSRYNIPLELATEIENALKPKQIQKSKVTPLESQSQEESTSIYGVPKDATTLVLSDGEEILTPNEETQSNIGFIFNNLSQPKTEMFEEKVRTLKSSVDKIYYPYLCYYIVVERAATQLGHQDTYVQLIISMKDKDFENRIMDQTYKSIRTLLKSPLKKENTLERKLLKTLGEWLGRLTLERNKPILVKELELQQLLIQSFEKGNLPAVAAFVSKTMTYVEKSDVFKPPNPWTMMILSLLKEIHSHRDVETSVKFDVEILLNVLKMKLADIPVREKPFLTNVKISSISSQSEREFDVSLLPEIIKLGLGNDTIIPNHEIFINNPGLKAYAIFSVESAIRDVMPHVIKKSTGVACKTTYELVTKDFIMDTDSNKFRRSAVQMARWLAGKWAIVSCKEPVFISIYSHMKEYLESSAIQKDNVAIKIEEACKALANANLTFACNIIEDSSMEKAEQIILESLSSEIEQRNKFHVSGGQVPYTLIQENPYFQSVSEILMSNPTFQSNALQVYDYFSNIQSNRSISTNIDGPSGISLGTQRAPQIPFNIQQIPQAKIRLTFDEVVDVINKILNGIMSHAQKLKQDTRLNSLASDTEIVKNLTLIPKLLRKCEDVNKICSFLAENMIQLSFNSNRSINPFMRDVYIYFLRVSTQACPEIVNQISNWWDKSDDTIPKYGEVSLRYVLEGIIDYEIVDRKLSIAIKKNVQPAIIFAIDLLNEGVQKTQKFKVEQFADTLEVLNQTVSNIPLVNELYSKVSKIHSSYIKFEIESTQDSEQYILMFENWIKIYEKNLPNEMENFVKDLVSNSMKSAVDYSKYCKVLIRYTVDHFYTEYNNRIQKELSTQDVAAVASLFSKIDAYTKLTVSIINHFKSDLTFIRKPFEVVRRILYMDHETNPDTFNQRVYQRIFSNLLILFHQLNDNSLSDKVVNYFSQLLYDIRPERAPGFAFSWVDLLSHRFYMPKVLNLENGYEIFNGNLICLFSFLKPHLEKHKLSESIELLYRATLKILLVLLHDFSDFLCEYYNKLCDEIAPNCIQMKNMILSAYPRDMQIPDVNTPNLKVDLIPEIHTIPTIHLHDKYPLKELIDLSLKNRSQPLHELISALRLSTEQALETGKRFNIELINYLVIYIGTNVNNSGASDTSSSDILKKLVYELDAEGRYHVLNAIANQLRYPNRHTFYFSRVILDLFAGVILPDDEELIQEQITRVITERLFGSRPHPWGLIVTFIELIKNSRDYRLFEKQFIQCDQEIAKLFVAYKTKFDKDSASQQY